MAVAFDLRDDELLGMADVARVAGVSLATVRTWCLTGRLAWIPGARSSQRLVRRSDLAMFLAEQSAGTDGTTGADGRGQVQVSCTAATDDAPSLIAAATIDDRDAVDLLSTDTLEPNQPTCQP